jgi:hypothetical protein
MKILAESKLISNNKSINNNTDNKEWNYSNVYLSIYYIHI